MPIEFSRVIPTLRMFDIRKAREFYIDYLGFKVDFEHRFEPGLPLFMGISRGGIQLYLSEHHGDGSPGVHITIDTVGVAEPSLRRKVTTICDRASRSSHGAPPL